MYLITSVFYLLFCSITFATSTSDIKKTLVKYFDGQNLGRGQLQLIIDGHPLRVHVVAEMEKTDLEQSALVIAPEGAGTSDSDVGGSCLRLEIKSDHTGYLSWISTTDHTGEARDCGIHPSVKEKGKFLLSFVDKVAAALKLPSVSLIDVSAVWCKKNNKEINLRFLNLAKGSMGWYEKNGYSPVNLSARDKSLGAIQGLQLSQVMTSLDAVSEEYVSQTIDELKKRQVNGDLVTFITYWQNFPSRRSLLQELVKNIDQSMPLSAFLNTLYKNGDGCDLYSVITSLLIPPLIEGYPR